MTGDLTKEHDYFIIREIRKEVLQVSCSKYSFSPAAKKYVREQIPVISKKEAETRENMMLLGGLVIGLTAGVVIGAGIAALTAPRSGEETRQNIRDKKDFAVSEVKETSNKVAGKVKTKADDVVGRIKDNSVVEKIKDKFAKDDEEVVVEYTIRYDDEDEPSVEVAEDVAEAVEEAVEDVAEAAADVAEDIAEES